LEQDKDSHVACEVLISDVNVFVVGELLTSIMYPIRWTQQEKGIA
jgi:S-adenosylmethionine synthetase